jgi:tetratricopeptide (TPR) repeat protein
LSRSVLKNPTSRKKNDFAPHNPFDQEKQLTEPRDRHLDEIEIDALASAPELALNPDGASEPVLRRALGHMAECESCKRKVLIHRAVQREITQSGPLQETSPGSDCAVDTNWIDVAAGLLPKPITAELTKHASQCGYCGPRLKKAVETLFAESTPAEIEILSSLKSARPEWPKEMVKTLRMRGDERHPKPVSRWQSYFRWPKLVFAAAMSAAVALASWLTVVMLRPLPVEQLLAQASSEKRTLELRMPGAKHGKLQIERGPAKSSSDKASSLLKAESLIREHLDKTPNNPQWLQAQGRADLLGGDPDSAIKHFEKARESDPDSPSLMADLGSAYYARHTGSDWGKAYEWLDHALAKAPEDPTLLFNHAIVAESAGFPNVAEADWNHYLQLESSGEWSDEARERLRKLEEKKEDYKKRHSQLLLEPSELEAQSGSPQTQAIVDARIEEYLHLAIQNWLPNAYPANGQHPPDMEARAALAVLSRIMHSKHKDAWLEDLLANSEGQGFGAAVQALSAALAGNDRGAYDAAYRESLLAERTFLAEHNPAGAMQARFQRLFALQFKRNGRLCAEIPAENPQEVNTSYPWLQAQILLEESACLSMRVEIGQARSKIDQAMVIAQASRYNEIRLRCFTFSAGNAALIGDTKAVWTMVLESLNAFWAGNYPALRGYNLYTLLSEVASPPAFPHLRVAAWSQGISLIDSDPDLLQRGLAHFYLAQAAMDAHLVPLFDSEYREYNRLLDRAPTGEAEKADRAEAQLQMAKMEVRLGHLDQAHDQLTGWLWDTIQDSGDTYRAADFYATLGELELELGNNQDAGRFLRSGLLVTEHILGTLSKEKERTEWERKASPIYRALVEERLREEDAAGALEVWEWYLGAAIREHAAPAASSLERHLLDRLLMEGVPLSTLNVVAANRSRLTRQTVLSYALLRDGVAIWAFDNRGVFHAYVHRNPREIEQLARHFLELCANRDSDRALPI